VQKNQGDQNYLGLLSVSIASKVKIAFHFETPEPIMGGVEVEGIQNFATHCSSPSPRPAT
jgi:hypothetical protein